VIGSGFGGLAAAVRLGARGYRVTVVDKLDAPGGRAYVHRQDGFTFDAGPTVITAPFLFEELWSLCGRRLADDIDLRPVSPFYRIRFHDGVSFDYTGDAEAMRAEVGRLAPGDVKGYERFVQMSESIFRVGFEELAHVPFGTWTDMARIVPDMVKLESYRTVYGLVSKYVKDDRLRQVLSFHPLLVGGNPFSTTSIYTLRSCAAWCRSSRGSGARCAATPRCGRSWWSRGARAASSWPRARSFPRTWWCPTPTRRGPTATSCRPSTAGAGPIGASSGSAIP
jgi:phytoene desaturase